MAGATYYLTGANPRALVKVAAGRLREFAGGEWVETNRYLGTDATPISDEAAARFVAARARAAASPPAPSQPAPGACASAQPRRRGLMLHGTLALRVLAFAAAAARGEFDDETREVGQQILASVEADAERRERRRARRGQLVLAIALARSYPTLPRWRLRRRRPTATALESALSTSPNNAE